VTASALAAAVQRLPATVRPPERRCVPAVTVRALDVRQIGPTPTRIAAKHGNCK